MSPICRSVARQPLPTFEQRRPGEQDGHGRPECDVRRRQISSGRRNPEQCNYPAEKGSDGTTLQISRIEVRLGADRRNRMVITALARSSRRHTRTTGRKFTIRRLRKRARDPPPMPRASNTPATRCNAWAADALGSRRAGHSRRLSGDSNGSSVESEKSSSRRKSSTL